MRNTRSSKCPDCRRAYAKEQKAKREKYGARPLHRSRVDPDTGKRVKTCPDCLATKAEDDYNVGGGRLRSYCRDCESVRRRAMYHANADRHRAYARKYYWKNRSAVLARTRKWRKENRAYCIAYNRRQNERRREEMRQYARRRYWSMTPEQRAEMNRRHNAKRVDYHRIYDSLFRKQRNARVAKWARENRERKAQIQRERNRRVWRATIAKIDRDAVIARDNSMCYLCGMMLERADVTLDHVVPLSRGGDHAESNLRVCCRRCNSRKGTRLLSELDWAAR